MPGESVVPLINTLSPYQRPPSSGTSRLDGEGHPASPWGGRVAHHERRVMPRWQHVHDAARPQPNEGVEPGRVGFPAVVTMSI
jgi:hypothetical protein